MKPAASLEGGARRDEKVRKKLDMRHHKAILSITLFILLIIAIIFGGYLATASPGDQVLGVMTFSLIFLVFVLVTLIISMLIRTRDELHAMHEENRQHFQNVHERIRTVHAAVTAKKR